MTPDGPTFAPGHRVHVAGHRGLVGSAIVRALRAAGFTDADLILRTHAQCDLADPRAVEALYAQEQPEHVIVAAAKVGGILANDTHPVEFLRDNLGIELAVIAAAHRAGVRKLLFLGSSCIYPRDAPQPLREESLLSGPLESTNEWYAIAKIAGIKLCQAYRRQHGADFISAMPTNLYGPHDNFDLTSSHVLPALMRKLHEARMRGADEVEVWGSGTPRREFLHVDDMASACLHLMRTYSEEQFVNIGVGEDLTIRELAQLIADVVGFEGTLRFDPSRPDGTPRKLMDVSRLTASGWTASTSLREGIKQTYAWFREHVAETSSANR